MTGNQDRDSDHDHLRRLTRQIHTLRMYCVGLTMLIIGGLVVGFASKAQEPDVLRLKGIIIEDDQGRERILIGAPIPHADHRVRTDFDKAVKQWGKRFPNMDWFKKLNHSSYGMLILDENGIDRVGIGSPTPDPNIGRRIGPSHGIVINDEQGFERSGYGYIPDHSVGLGLDHRSGEGMNLFIMKDGTNGILIRDKGGLPLSFIGHAPAKSFLNKTDTPVQGLSLTAKNGAKAFFNAATNPPSIELLSESGEPVGKLPE
ncbi:MAG: hypothetical protein O7F76_04010 [Planctomycetota bacterium]|nr:hypothetical protein [Planctomycetota bacterium]